MMTCKTCKEEGKEPERIYDRGSSSTLISWDPFWDRDGAYHRHDPNVHERHYVCSNGHHWSEKSKEACPVPDCQHST